MDKETVAVVVVVVDFDDWDFGGASRLKTVVGTSGAISKESKTVAVEWSWA